MVTIGVTGHRVLQEPDTVSDAVALALSSIKQVFPADDFTVISPLAEGADRLAAKQAMRLLSAELVVPLPLERTDYLQDFKTEMSKEEFNTLIELAQQVIQLPQGESRTDSYLNAGMYVLNHCDVLLALWDGKPARGTGGTRQIVEEARRLDKPLVWVPVNIPTSGQRHSLDIRFERFPSGVDKAGDR